MTTTTPAPAAAGSQPPPRPSGGRWRALLSGGATPQRLRRLGALLVVACLATAVVSVLDGSVRAGAVGADGTRLATLDFDAAELYRSLNGANALATSGFGAAATSSPTLVAAYDSNVTGAGLRLVHAAGLLGTDGTERADAALVEQIVYDLPRYTATVDSARALRAQGSPRAQAELDGAVGLMRTILLPAADTLQQNRRAALTENYERASGFPVLPVLLALVTLVLIGYAAVRERRRTHRVLNVGLTAAGVLVAVALVWWLGATLSATGRLDTARASNDAATSLSRARVIVLQARADETVAVAGGRPTAPGAIPADLSGRFDALLAPDGELATAASTPGSSAAVVSAIRTGTDRWRDAVATVGPGSDPSRIAFVRLTATLSDGIGAEQGERSAAAQGAGSALAGIAYGPAVLVLLGAVAAAAGIGVRLREYRG